MQLYINTEKLPASVQLRPTSQPIGSLRLKRGAAVSLQVIVMGTTPVAHLRLGVKTKNDYGGELLLLAHAPECTPTDDGTLFNLSLDVSSVPLHEALGIGSGSPLASVAAMAEFEWQEGEATRLSDTLSTVILNDIISSASDVPAAVATEYPAADRVATKDWVNTLEASADKPGLAKLGTDTTIPDIEAVPVGVTKAGGLAVDGSSLSAYALACRHGFTGTEAEWLASLKGADGTPGAPGEQGERGEQGPQGEAGEKGEPGQSVTAEEVADLFCIDVIQSSGAGNDNANAYGFSFVTRTAGKLVSLSMMARSNNSLATTAPLWCKVWLVGDTGTALLATSENSQIQTYGNYAQWLFPAMSESIPQGAVLRATFHVEEHKDESVYGQNLSAVSYRCSPNSLANTGCLNVRGEISTSSVVPVYKCVLRAFGFAPLSHVDDDSRHLSAAESSYLQRLVGNTEPPNSTGVLVTEDALLEHNGDSTLHLSNEQRKILDNLKFGEVVTVTGDLGVHDYTVTASLRGAGVRSATLTSSGIMTQITSDDEPTTYDLNFPAKSGTLVVLTDAELAKLQALLESCVLP